jgi:hypothetical protein
MEHYNNTREQHYVSRAEQQLNATNPTAKPKNQTLYCFAVGDREHVALAAETAKIVKIATTLVASDLFSFDIQGNLRANLERQFQAYEAGISRHSVTLLKKMEARDHGDLKADLLGLFVCKFVGFLRNPHCITKVLNTIGALADYTLTDERHADAQQALLRGNRPHRDWLSARFGVSTEAYEQWVRALFMLSTPEAPGQPNVLERTLKHLLETRFVSVRLNHYLGECSEETCLLSDRGHVLSVESESIFALDFNISRSAFVTFAFCDIDAFVPPGTPERYVDALKRRREVVVHYNANDLRALARYNANAVFQCASTVYAARRQVRTSFSDTQ